MADRWRMAAAFAALTSVGACSFAPPYRPPAIETPASFKEAGPWMPATPAASLQPRQWWTVFGDPVLDALEQRLDNVNPGVAGALARYDQARAYLAEARGEQLPTIGIEASATRNRQSNHRPLRGANQPDLYPADTLGGIASFELDLWGRVRNSVAAGKAQADASDDDLAAIRLSLEAQLATGYIRLRGLDAQARLLSRTVDAFAKADAMTQRRYSGGAASALDTGRSGTELAEAQAQLADVAASRALAEHAIASLVGEVASSFSIVSVATDMPLPNLPAVVPSTLLQRRPDIAAAERRMAAANAEIGVVKAAFFPAIGLGGQGGVQNTGISDLLTAPNIFWSVGPSTVLNLFDGGKRRARVAIARARWDQATADYRNHVLNAFQEVEDNLARLHHYGIEADAENRAVQQASQTEALSLNRYAKGAVNYLEVVTAQTAALRTRRQALTLDSLRLEASVNLIRALGGGWTGDATAQNSMDTPPLSPPTMASKG